MENQQTQRLLYDRECKDCNRKTMCEWADTSQCCRVLIDKLRVELRESKKHHEIIAKIAIITEYVFDNQRLTMAVVNRGIFVLKEPYRFGEPFLRAEITGECDSGIFSTEYYKWK
jgi:hypothetical protein